MGPGVKTAGELQGEWYSNQIAATALQLLGFDPAAYSTAAGKPMVEILTSSDTSLKTKVSP
jgi:hypothetical protein